MAGVRPHPIGPVCVVLGCYLDDSGPCQCSSSHQLTGKESISSCHSRHTHRYTHWRADKMILLPLAWALLTASLWKSGSSQTLLEDPVTERYPDIHSNETIDCDCGHTHCDFVYWFYSNLNTGEVQYIGKCNNADRDAYGPGVQKGRFKIQKRGGMSFVLRIIDVTEADAGIYSCVLKDKSQSEVWKPGVLLRPGVSPPTPPPKIKPKPSVCRCPPKNPPAPDGCGSVILWPLVGLVASLALALICTLYYFSRLPKKCRHNFVKKRQMT